MAEKLSYCPKGFTIIETLVTIFVFALIWAVIMGGIVVVYRTQGYSMQQSQAINEARRGVDTMAREIRQIKIGSNGSYPIEMAAGKEFIFYSDIDADGQVERVRYYLATMNSGSLTQTCSTNSQGGSCSVTFSNFLTGTLKTAQLQVSAEGDFGSAQKYATVTADGTTLGNICRTGSPCSRCAGTWQGMQTYDVATLAQDNSLQVTITATNSVSNTCSWGGNHKLKAQFAFSFTEEIPNQDNQLKKGVIHPVGSPVTYPANQEQITTISSYVRNAPPIFTYYDENNALITTDPATTKNTRMMKLLMVVNVDPNRPPNDYQLEQYIQLRNLKTN